VNDPPTFTLAGTNVNTTAASPPQTVAGWATATPGPANESNQTVTYTVTLPATAPVFVQDPQISPDGTLTFQPPFVVLQTTPVTVTVTAQDNGTPPQTSAQQTFTITINP
jgi:hypothetical protein